MASMILSKDINLLPKYKVEESANKRSYERVLLSMTTILLALVFVGFFSVRSYYGLVDYRATLIADIAMFDETERKMTELATVRAAIEVREKYQDNIDKTNTSMIQLLEFLEKETSNGVFLNGFSDSSTQSGNKQITITGAAISKDVIADFQDKLGESGLFSSIFVPTLTLADRAESSSVFGDPPSDIPLLRFSIVCVLV